MKTYKENLTAYIRVIEMCEKYNKEHGTDVKPWSCVKYRGDIILDGSPRFNGDPECYVFAISILEAKPLFVGAKVWLKNVKKWVIIDTTNPGWIYDKCCSWDSPIVTINGVELPRPLKEPSTSGHSFTYECEAGSFYFNDYQELRKWEDYFKKLLLEARDKED